MRISQLASAVAESATLRINDRAARLKAEGKPVINLGVGEPQNRAPASAVQAVEAKLRDGRLKYTSAAGIPSLRQAVARQASEAYSVQLEPANVIVANGSKQALFNALAAVVDPGDEVLFPAPYWVSYPEMVKLVRGAPVVVPPAAGSLQPDLEAMQAAIGERTRAVILNTPNNPSGLIYPAEFIHAMVEACETHQIWLIMDDIYRQLVFDEQPPAVPFSYASHPVDQGQLIVVDGLSKTYGLTGLRLGWAIAPAPLVVAMNKIQGQTTSNASVLSQAAAEGALGGDQTPVAELVEHLRANRDLMLGELRSIDGVQVETPGGALYCFPDCSGLEADSTALAELLLEKALVATVPGVAFGMEGYLRLGFAGPREEVVEGMRRIRWALDPDQPRELMMGDHRALRDWQ